MPIQGRVGDYRGFVDKYRVGSFPQIPDDDLSIWRSVEASYQPWWAIVRTDGTWESNRGFFPNSIIDEALANQRSLS